MPEPTNPEATNNEPTGEDDWLLDDPLEDAEVTEENPDGEPAPKDGEAEGAKPKADDPAAEQPAKKTGEDEADPANPEADKPKGEADAAKNENVDDAEQKRRNDEFAKQRIQQKEALRGAAQVFVDNAKAAVEDAGDDEVKRELAEIKAREAQRDANDFLREVETNQSVMQNDHSRVQREIDIFRPTNDDGTPNQNFNQTAYDMALEHLAPHLVTQEVQGADGTKHVVILRSNVSVYGFLKKEAEGLKSMVDGVRTQATVQGQQAEQQMRGAAEPTRGGTPPPKAQSTDDKEASEMRSAFSS